ncbi:macro domain-containing protein [Sporosarcina sp. FSL W7-1283]|uniref:macro domain-containing protein n=1 Tax=Sporosarcina sp. FSL W7-1283 TaxID=2921560 RepID=UPI0030FC40CE
MIKQVIGNLLDAPEVIIGHQVNCKFVMGAGLAKQIRQVYPEAYYSYMSASHQSDLLGKIQVVNINSKRTVVNLFAQYNYGRTGLYTDYQALKETLVKLRKYASKNNLGVALPYGLGCGLAGGDWNTVIKIIEDAFDGYQVATYKLP